MIYFLAQYMNKESKFLDSQAIILVIIIRVKIIFLKF